MNRTLLLTALTLIYLVTSLSPTRIQAQQSRQQITQAEVDQRMEALQGTWQMVSRTTEGRTHSDGVVNETSILFENHSMTVSEGEHETVQAAFQIFPGAEHKELILTLLEGPGRGQKLKGIYEIDGDELRICFSFGSERPGSFDASAGSENELLELRREKSPTSDEGWKEFKLDEHRLALSFPGKPEHQQLPSNESGQAFSINLYQFVSENTKTAYQLSVYDIKETELTETKEKLGQFGLQFARKFNADEVNEKSLELYGSPAHELEFSATIGIKGKVTSIVFGNRLISMTVIGRDDDPSLDTSTKRFIDSLILMDE